MGRAAQRYAKAVLSLAKDRNQTEEVNGEMMLVMETLASNADLSQALKSPTIGSQAKRKVLDEVFKSTGEITHNLFGLLLENKRIESLGEVAKKYTVLYNEMNNIRVATVTTAVELTPEMEKKVMSKVHELTGGNASLINKVNPEILGGFILRIGDLQYDASVSGNLNRLKREFKKTNSSLQKYKSNGVSKNTVAN
jgi:F-type H+-transporting ATPase subunit delta